MLKQLNSLRSASVSEEGFTLIELIIVVVIIGVLAAIAIPAFVSQQKAALAAGIKSDVKNTNIAIVSELTTDPTSAFVGGHNAVDLSKAAPYFFVGTPEDGITPVTAGAAEAGDDANVKATISDSATVIQVYGYWNNYVIDAHNTNLVGDGHNYFSYRSNTGVYSGTGDLR